MPATQRRYNGRWSPVKLQQALDSSNKIIMAMSRALLPLRKDGLVNFEWINTHDKRIVLLNVYWNTGKPWTLAMYVTTQESRPLSPRDVLVRLQRLRRFVARNTPPHRDTTVVLLAATPRVKTTRGARRILAKAKIKLMTPQELIEFIASYLDTRRTKLVEALNRLGNAAKNIPKNLEMLSFVFGYIVAKLRSPFTTMF